MLQKNRLLLLTVGVGMVASLGIARLFPWFWVPGIILALTGAYLIIWATWGRGQWCRSCKQFRLF